MPHLHIHVYQKLLAMVCHIFTPEYLYIYDIFSGSKFGQTNFFYTCIIAKIPKQLKEECNVKRN